MKEGMTESSLSLSEETKLLEAARISAKRAYAPYSKFRVGAAVLTEAGGLFTGCNVENASLGLTMCAERVAIFSAVAHEGGDTLKIRAVAVLTDSSAPCSPCGACRQVILELGPEANVLFQGVTGITRASAKELLPGAFEWNARR